MRFIEIIYEIIYARISITTISLSSPPSDSDNTPHQGFVDIGQEGGARITYPLFNCIHVQDDVIIQYALLQVVEPILQKSNRRVE